MEKVRTRYAPSPTGSFHIGGAWMAFFNYLYAKHNNGDFIFRVEDTDIERNIENGGDIQLNGLEWLGIIPDESPKKPGEYGPYIQSGKFNKFKEAGEELVKQGKAYYCFCTSEELEESRKIAEENHQTPKYNRKCLKLSESEIAEKINANVSHAIRLKMPDNGNIEWEDLVRGKMSIPVDALTDPVIVKSNGIPTYNFAVVLDDHEMHITHVLRGNEHLSNTPYQIAIMNALGYDSNSVKFGHLTIIVDETGKKLSKRNKELKQFILSENNDDYVHMGYHPKGIINFISLLGWSPKNNEEFFELNKIVEIFDYTRLSVSPTFFDIKKMNYFSNYYIKNDFDNVYLENVKKFIKFDTNIFGDKLDYMLLSFKQNLNYYDEINTYARNTYVNYDLNNFNEEVNQLVSSESFKTCISALDEVLSAYNTITPEMGNEIVNKVKEKTNLKGKELFMPIRIIAIGKEHGPEMNKILYIVGKEKIKQNISNFLNK